MALAYGSEARVLVAALLLITTGPWMPVLCSAAGHSAIEPADAPCCAGARLSGVGTAPRSLEFSALSASGCGGCVDAPLVSAGPLQQVERTVNLEAAPAAVPVDHAVSLACPKMDVPDRAEGPPSSFSDPCALPLRC